MSRKGVRRRYQLRRKGASKGSGRKDPTRLDPYQRAARAEGYRARSAYKLMQINQRFKILRPGMVVLDLGAAPGGWSQVASMIVKSFDVDADEDGSDPTISDPLTQHTEMSNDEYINAEDAETVMEEPTEPKKGKIISIDLVPIKPLPGCIVLTGDLTLEATLDQVAEHCPRGQADAVISDISPKLSGNYDMDQARSVHLSTTALNIAKMWLSQGGSFVVKVFEGTDFVDFRQEVKKSFVRVRSFSPSASRKASSEVYLVATGFKGK